jgi:hypothetical protein
MVQGNERQIVTLNGSSQRQLASTSGTNQRDHTSRRTNGNRALERKNQCYATGYAGLLLERRRRSRGVTARLNVLCLSSFAVRSVPDKVSKSLRARAEATIEAHPIALPKAIGPLDRFTRKFI